MVIPILSIFLPISILFLAILLDLFLGDPSPHNPRSLIYRLHPAVVIGNFIGVIKPYFKNHNPKIAKLNGAFLGLITILTFSLPIYFGLGVLYTFFHIGVYTFFAIIFKAINTLDGMVGFKDKEHKDIGWFSAKLDTVAVSYTHLTLPTTPYV